MRTVKLVLIGPSGVGKTALRGKYITGRFFGAYRTTIGTDFITKSLPHPTNPEEKVTLQIWDTAGQERFSSLSSAFFRGADAALLIFDVNSPDTMESLIKWWDEFSANAPLDDDDMESFCCVVVGNKIDIGVNNRMEASGGRVTESEALQFLKRLVPLRSDIPGPNDGGNEDTPIVVQPPSEPEQPQVTSRPTHSIAIAPSQIKNWKYPFPHPRANNSSLYATVSSINSGISSYHTPSSSLFNSFESPVSSPLVSLSPPRYRRGSNETASSFSTDTVTPSLFARGNTETRTSGSLRAATTIPDDDDTDQTSISLPTSLGTSPAPPFHGPKLFFTSAKTGDGVAEVFEYIARRVAIMSDYQERTEASRLHMRESGASDWDMIQLQSSYNGKNRKQSSYNKWSCCAS
ncbi:hypothetical protein APHAL10511_002985 [Amanita phalloides]|nr:hypothetical protein APHAL10511_002985 [Amanita phalloides]